MRILIIGGCGFIGANAFFYLKSKKHKISIKHTENQLFLYDSAKKRWNFNIFASGDSWCKNINKTLGKPIILPYFLPIQNAEST